MDKTFEEYQEDLKDLWNDRVFGNISIPEYYDQYNKIAREMEKVDTRPNCTFSADPTGEPDPLAKAKRKATDELKARRKKGEVSGLNFARQIIDIANARTIEQVKEIATFKRPKK